MQNVHIRHCSLPSVTVVGGSVAQQQLGSFQSQVDKRRDLLAMAEINLKSKIANLEGQLSRSRDAVTGQVTMATLLHPHLLCRVNVHHLQKKLLHLFVQQSKSMFLYSAVSSPLDRSNRFLLHPLADLFIPTQTRLLLEEF